MKTKENPAHVWVVTDWTSGRHPFFVINTRSRRKSFQVVEERYREFVKGKRITHDYKGRLTVERKSHPENMHSTESFSVIVRWQDLHGFHNYQGWTAHRVPEQC